MAASKIGGQSDLLAAIRSQVSKRTDRLGGVDPGLDERGKVGTEVAQAVPFDLSELRKRLGKELKSIDIAAPDNRRRARRAFIESVMCWDLGDGLLNSPEFGIVVTEVENSMSNDSATVELLDEIIVQLRES
jgi:hypothetical protein